MNLRTFLALTVTVLLSGCSVIGPSPTVPFSFSGTLTVGGAVLSSPFTVKCQHAEDCSYSLKLTSMQPDPVTNVALELVAYAPDATGVMSCRLGTPLASTITVQGGTGLGGAISNNSLCAVVIDIGQLHETQTVTVSGQIPSY